MFSFRSFLLRSLPKKRLSALAGWLVRVETPWVKRALIRWFIKVYAVDLSEAEQEDERSYPSFHAFFIRRLKKNARPSADSFLKPFNSLVSPVDGRISQLGSIRAQTLIQAKSKRFTLASLLGDDYPYLAGFNQGYYLTCYLSPKDYHRVHMPVSGRLKQMRYIPGKLFPVNAWAVSEIDQLFAQNERVIALFETAQGHMAVIFVGAMLVGSISTVWHGSVQTSATTCQDWDYTDSAIHFNTGDELGYFSFGSTVILLLEPSFQFPFQFPLSVGVDSVVRMGQVLG